MTTGKPEQGRIIRDLKRAIADWPQLSTAEREKLRADVERRVRRVI